MVETALTYPRVRDEWETIRAVAAGRSIARFGDGELKMMHGRGYVREPGSQRLAEELRSVLQTPAKGCIVGIPTMDPIGPKFANWIRHEARYTKLLSASVDYYSSLISRPDSAPWIFDMEFVREADQIWKGKHVAVLSEPTNSILRVVTHSAAAITFVPCPSEQAYARIDEFELHLSRLGADVIVMSAGPTATCLANRLTRRGLQGVDIGSAGGFMWKLINRTDHETMKS